ARRANRRLEARRRKGVALLDLAALGAGTEPANPLLRAAMGEGLRHDDALGALHDVVVAHCRRGAHGLLDVARLEPAPRLLRMVGPDAGEAVGLQLEAYRELVVVALVQLPARLVHLLHCAQEVLDVLADLVRDHVGLGEIPARAEALAQHLVEAEIDVDGFVRGTVEGAGRGAPHAARGGRRAGVEDELPRPVARSRAREHRLPCVLGARQHHRDELPHLVLDRPRARGLLLARGGAAGPGAVDHAEQRERIDPEQPGDDQADDDGPQADAAPAAGAARDPHATQTAESPEATAAAPPVLDVRALSLPAPPHAQFPTDPFIPGFCLDRAPGAGRVEGAGRPGPRRGPRTTGRMNSSRRGKRRFMRLSWICGCVEAPKADNTVFYPASVALRPRAAAGAPSRPGHPKSTGSISH